MKPTDKDIEYYTKSLRAKGFILERGPDGQHFVIRHIDTDLPHSSTDVRPWTTVVEEEDLFLAVRCIAGGWYSREYWTHVAETPYSRGRYKNET